MDILQPFQIEGTPIHGRFVRLGPSISTIIRQHEYPPLVAQFLAELTTLTAALSGGLKGEKGLLTCQIKGDGPLDLLVADATTEGHLRGFSQFKEEEISHFQNLSPTEKDSLSIPRLVGKGHLLITIDPGSQGERYQGIVALDGRTLSDCLHSYFRQSEQLAGAIKLGACPTGDGQWVSGTVLLQKMPPEEEGNTSLSALEKKEEDWEVWYEALALLGSLSPQELLDPSLSPSDILYRLFHQRGVRLYNPKPLIAHCRCSAARVQALIESFTEEEKASLCQQGFIGVRCEFCNQEYNIPWDSPESLL
jgi:molecular chaperone Hsp33